MWAVDLNAQSMSPANPVVVHSEDTVTVRDGTKLHTYRWTSDVADAKTGGVVLMAHGYSEYGRRYDELARYLVSQGFPVYGYDARGHGFSPGQRGHIDRYARYVDDCTDVAKDLTQKYPKRPLILLGHSNGGLTVLRTVQRGEAPVAGLVMSCPMVALRRRHRPMSHRAATITAALLSRVPLPNGIDPQQLTHDAGIAEAWRADPMNHGKTTPRWYLNALDAMEAAWREADKVSLPVLTLAAERDSVVDTKRLKEFAATLASPDRELLEIPEAFHEVLQEVDRAETFRKIGQWLSSRFAR